MPNLNQFQQLVVSTDVVILNTASLSAAKDLQGTSLVGLILPAAWTTADITFEGGIDGTVFNAVYDITGAELTVSAAVDRYVTLSPQVFAGIRFLKIRSGTAGTPVGQAADRTVVLVTRPV